MKTVLSAIGTYLVALKLSAALLFNGTSSLVNFGDRDSYDGLTKIGIMSWVYMDNATGAYAGIMGDIATGTFDNGWMIQRNIFGSALHVPICNGSGTTVGDTPAGSFTSNSWHHLVVNYDGSQVGNAGRLQVYIEGVSQTLAFTGTIPASIGANSGALIAGSYDGIGGFFTGFLDDIVIVAGRTFTANERDIHFKSKVRRLVNANSHWALDGYPNGGTVNNAAIVDTGPSQFHGIATNCVAAASLFMSYP